MKFIHLSDLHIGKRVNEISMIEEQEHILNQILQIIDDENPDAVIIAGDVYDKSVPTTEAVELLDSFLFRLSKRDAEVFIISGNHDSSERLAFGSRLIDQSGIHIAPVYRGEVAKHTVKGVNIYLLPFIKPVHVRPYFESEKINTYNDALRQHRRGGFCRLRLRRARSHPPSAELRQRKNPLLRYAFKILLLRGEG